MSRSYFVSFTDGTSTRVQADGVLFDDPQGDRIDFVRLYSNALAPDKPVLLVHKDQVCYIKDLGEPVLPDGPNMTYDEYEARLKAGAKQS